MKGTQHLMAGLREQIQSALRGRVCFMGLGNVEGGDDGFGVRLAEALARAGVPDVVAGGTAPEQLAGRCAAGGFDHLVFLDAVEVGAAPGSVVFLNSQEMAARFPQISTHHIALGLLARYVESSGRTRAWLLGAQPASLQRAPAISPPLQTTLTILTELIGGFSTPNLNLNPNLNPGFFDIARGSALECGKQSARAPTVTREGACAPLNGASRLRGGD
ncbi:MAG: hydrogenase maturation protease [Verrucomicrobiota bacterium]